MNHKIRKIRFIFAPLTYQGNDINEDVFEALGNYRKANGYDIPFYIAETSDKTPVVGVEGNYAKDELSTMHDTVGAYLDDKFNVDEFNQQSFQETTPEQLQTTAMQQWENQYQDVLAEANPSTSLFENVAWDSLDNGLQK